MAGAPLAVQQEWRGRVIAEYGSAAVTISLLTWLMRLGASPTLLHEATRIIDETDNGKSRLVPPPAAPVARRAKREQAAKPLRVAFLVMRAASAEPRIS